MRIEEHGTSRKGEMTTEHAASSYGQPVAVFGDVAYGPAEVSALVALDDDAEMIEAARRAGYQIDAAGDGERMEP